MLKLIGDAELFGAEFFDLLVGIFLADGVVFVEINEALQLLFEIGDELGVTERTIKAYAQELYDKLGVRNRAGAVAEAARLGMLKL